MVKTTELNSTNQQVTSAHALFTCSCNEYLCKELSYPFLSLLSVSMVTNHNLFSVVLQSSVIKGLFLLKCLVVRVE